MYTALIKESNLLGLDLIKSTQINSSTELYTITGVGARGPFTLDFYSLSDVALFLNKYSMGGQL